MSLGVMFFKKILLIILSELLSNNYNEILYYYYFQIMLSSVETICYFDLHNVYICHNMGRKVFVLARDNVTQFTM